MSNEFYYNKVNMSNVKEISEGLLIWLKRSRYETQDIARELFISRQELETKIKKNSWTLFEVKILKRIGVV